jgi:hypothetical protein
VNLNPYESPKEIGDEVPEPPEPWPPEYSLYLVIGTFIVYVIVFGVIAIFEYV